MPLEAEPTVTYPCVYVDSEQMPEVKDMSIGEEKVVTFTVRLKSAHEYDTEGKKISADLELRDYAITNDRPEKDLD